MALPEVARKEALVIVFATLTFDGERRSRNTYWLANPMDELAPAKESDWYYTPVRKHADLSGLLGLPTCQLELSAHASEDATDVTISIRNMSETPLWPALGRLYNRTQEQYQAPCIWSDNFDSLLPLERADLTVRILEGIGSDDLEVVFDGPNVVVRCPVGRTSARR